MKIKILFIIISLLFLACNEQNNKNSKVVGNTFYPYSKDFKGNHLTFHSDVDMVVERKDSLSNLHFLEFKKDSLIVNSKKINLSSPFTKDYLKLKEEFIQLNTMPRTLGKNLKSTDFLTKYDNDLQVILKKDMGILKYPSGNCLLVGDDNKLYYITDGFKFKENPKLVISEIDDSFNVLNQKIIDRKNVGAFRCDPLHSIFIKDIGLVIVSKLTFHNRNKPNTIKIEMFDLDLSKKWTEDIDANSTIYLGHSKSESKIILVTEKEGSKINFWNYKGNKQVTDYTINSNLIDITSNNNKIFLLVREQEKNVITKINFLGKVIESIDVPIRILPEEEIKTRKLIYRKKQLFLVSIDNSKNTLTINKLDIN